MLVDLFKDLKGTLLNFMISLAETPLDKYCLSKIIEFLL